MKTSLLLLLFLMSFNLFAQNDDSLVGYYSFDNCDLTDESGIGGDGELFGTPICVNGVKGNALYFTGEQYGIFEGQLNDFFEFSDFTISFWMKIKSGNRQNILGKRQECNANKMLEFNYSHDMINAIENRIGVQLREFNQNGNVFIEPFDSACWHLITYCRNNLTSILYQDGVLVEQVVTTEVVEVANNTPFYLSNSPCITYPDGVEPLQSILDELRIYNKALSHDEVAELYDFYMPKAPYDEIVHCNTTNVEVEIETNIFGEINWYNANEELVGQGNPAVLTLDASPFIVGELVDEFGCFYLDTIFVSRGESIVNNENITICEGEILEWQGQTFTESGYYDFTTSNLWGCEIGNFLALTVEVCEEENEGFDNEVFEDVSELKLLTYDISIFSLNGGFVKAVQQIGFNWKVPNQNLGLAKGAYIAFIEYTDAKGESRQESVKFFYAY